MSVFNGISLHDEVVISRPNLPQVTDTVAYVSDKRLVTSKGYKLYFEDNFKIEKTSKNFDPSAFGLTSAFWQPQITPAAHRIIEEAMLADLLAFPKAFQEVE